MRKGQKKPCPIRCLNGKTPMTPEERLARRKELESRPFAHANMRKRANAWRAKNRDRINARKRELYQLNREKEIAYHKAWRAAHKDACKRSWKKWAEKNRAHLRARDMARTAAIKADPKLAEEKRQKRRARMADPKRRNHERWVRRLWYHTHKHDEIGLRWRLKHLLIPRWERLMTEGPDAIERYRRRCTVETWSLLVKWARPRGVYLDPQKNGGRK